MLPQTKLGGRLEWLGLAFAAIVFLFVFASLISSTKIEPVLSVCGGAHTTNPAGSVVCEPLPHPTFRPIED